MAAQDVNPDAAPVEPQLDLPPNSSDIESLELFRRSPHPYHHRQSHHLGTSAGSSSNDFLRTSLQASNHNTSDDDGRKRRKISQSPSESGTEADDEGYGFIKALPAPPLRPHKGLRAPRGTGLDGGASPLLTPSLVEDEGFSFPNKKTLLQNGGPSPTDDEAKAARQKYLKRRRNEVVRRTTETALLAAISILAIHGSGSWTTLLQQHRGLFKHRTSCGTIAKLTIL